MSDALRNERLHTEGDVPDRDRDARIEQLLLVGLDHYFAGRNELAVSVWTRVLFLDRGHPRARAYIERARSALSERQRESEELLHTGVAAFDRGDAGAARRLLTSAVESGAANEEALALLDRLNRLELVKIAPLDPTARRSTVPVQARETEPDMATRPPSRVAWIATGAMAGLTVAAAAVWLWHSGHAPWSLETRDAPVVTSPRREEPLPVPTASAVSLTRAQSFQTRGRLHDALAALDSVRQGDALRPQADELRAAIQRQLLGAARARQQTAVQSPERTPRQ
jgi:hypothetical protein